MDRLEQALELDLGRTSRGCLRRGWAGWNGLWSWVRKSPRGMWQRILKHCIRHVTAMYGIGIGSERVASGPSCIRPESDPIWESPHTNRNGILQNRIRHVWARYRSGIGSEWIGYGPTSMRSEPVPIRKSPHSMCKRVLEHRMRHVTARYGVGIGSERVA